MNRTAWYILSGLLISIPVAPSSATTTATWNGFSESVASGTLDGIAITATSEGSAPFVGIVNGRFNADGSGGWDAPYPLDSATTSIVAANVNGGDSQEFRFENPIPEGLLYIENFDSNSIADITIGGGDVLELLAASPSISFTEVSASEGTLMTDNPSYNGEGDAILLFAGEVTRITIAYEQGDGANGVFYGFALQTVQSVPEPANYFAMLLGLPLFAIRHRRRS